MSEKLGTCDSLRHIGPHPKIGLHPKATECGPCVNWREQPAQGEPREREYCNCGQTPHTATCMTGTPVSHPEGGEAPRRFLVMDDSAGAGEGVKQS